MVGLRFLVKSNLTRTTRIGLLFILSLSLVAATKTKAKKDSHTRKISSDLQEKFGGIQVSQQKSTTAEIMVELHDISSTGEGASLLSANPKENNVLQELQTLTQNPQESRSERVTQLVNALQMERTKKLAPLVTELTKRKVFFESLWATGEMYVPQASWGDIQKIAKFDQVKTVRSPQLFSTPKPDISTKHHATPKKHLSWDLAMSNARCSKITCLGQGVKVGFLSSGALVTHKEIRKNWIGMPFGFYDGISPTANCTPRDDDGTGTFLTGVGVGEHVGVASKATWLMCMGCTVNICSEASLKICGHYLACPWKCNDTSVNKDTKDCSKRPDVIANGFTIEPFPLAVMKAKEDFYYHLVELWNALGIVSTFGAGDNGPCCNSGTPPSNYDISLAVGSVDINATWSPFSAVGPELSKRPLTGNSTATGTCERETCRESYTDESKNLCSLIKPDIAAPGDVIRSSFIGSDTSYAVGSSTMVAAAHVAGVVALMKCANRHLSWNYKLAYKILTSTAATGKIDLEGVAQAKDNQFSKDSNLLCNYILSDICNKYPNNMYGYGLVNACGAVKAAKKERAPGHH